MCHVRYGLWLSVMPLSNSVFTKGFHTSSIISLLLYHCHLLIHPSFRPSFLPLNQINILNLLMALNRWRYYFIILKFLCCSTSPCFSRCNSNATQWSSIPKPATTIDKDRKHFLFIILVCCIDYNYSTPFLYFATITYELCMYFQIGKGVCQRCLLSLCLFNFYAEYIMRNAGLEGAQAGIKIAGRNINKLRYADDTTLMAKSEEELKSLLMNVKAESETVGLKLNIQKTKIMASDPITSWQIDGETVETVSDFIFLGSKITADGDGSHEIKRCLLLGRKVMTNLDSMLENRDILCQQRSV